MPTLTRGALHTLNEADQQWALVTGPARRAANVARGCHQRPLDAGKQIELVAEQWACGAEIAFARMTRIPQPVLLRDQWVRQPNGWLPNGQPYDVSSTRYSDGRLLVPKKDHPPRDWIYVLLHVQWPTYRFLGWQAGEILIAYRWLTNPLWTRRSWAYGMSQRQLRDTLEYW